MITDECFPTGSTIEKKDERMKLFIFNEQENVETVLTHWLTEKS